MYYIANVHVLLEAVIDCSKEANFVAILPRSKITGQWYWDYRIYRELKFPLG